MKTLVERLRESSQHGYVVPSELLIEAAAQLERIEREAERYRKIREMPIHFLDDNDEHGATIYRMGTEVDAVVDRREAEFFATAPSPPDAPPRVKLGKADDLAKNV